MRRPKLTATEATIDTAAGPARMTYEIHVGRRHVGYLRRVEVGWPHWAAYTERGRLIGRYSTIGDASDAVAGAAESKGENPEDSGRASR